MSDWRNRAEVAANSMMDAGALGVALMGSYARTSIRCQMSTSSPWARASRSSVRKAASSCRSPGSSPRRRRQVSTNQRISSSRFQAGGQPFRCMTPATRCRT